MSPVSPAFRVAYEEALRLWPVAVEPVDVETEFGVTRVNACGPVDGPPLVLLSGGGTTSAGWYARAGGLARTHRVHAVDLMGGPGLSVPGGRALRRPADLAAWLDGVLAALGVERAALLGHSYGGWIALSYAVHAATGVPSCSSRACGKVERLVLLDPTQCFGGFRKPYLVRAVPLLVAPGEAAARRFLAWESRGGPGVAPEVVRLMGVGGREFRGWRPVTGPRPAVGRPGADRLGDLARRTLVVLAGRSRAHDARRVAEAAGRMLAGARVVTVPGVGHHALPELRSAVLERELSGFLAG